MLSFNIIGIFILNKVQPSCLSNYILFNTNSYIQGATLYTVEMPPGLGQGIPVTLVNNSMFPCTSSAFLMSVLLSNFCQFLFSICLYKSCPMYVTLFSLLARVIVFYCLLLCLLGTLCSRAHVRVTYLFSFLLSLFYYFVFSCVFSVKM